MTTPSNCYKVKAFFDELDRGASVEIQSSRFWFKVVEYLQTNWALIDERPDGKARVWFLNDNSGVFDSMFFESLESAVSGLMDNGFDLFEENSEARKFLVPPQRPFKREPHPNGRIYSDGKFWKRRDQRHE